ncbi:TetR family transcriptional regulator [Sphaerisporangium siamense]|uniref:AcrR family transcriptional regulator n=1 Tax=Sphaerisporangium siamense TaxID=795645 RepID=A0A7W7DDW4_9ACTN|nr:TetR/AcrR family transcriptional regulator [Sphaerisporangium siamense]MBB4705013.1 AcrR family transcriptional regulator [Sphaerisporangium siamense]GII83819.1 TetR family transcriptional regulator [Sphaerisporangium siamense]
MVTQQMGQAGPARAPGRPRSEKAERSIVDATIDLLAEGTSVAELSIEAVAARAGVGKTTIYRRWSNKEDLVVDALATLKPPLPEPLGRSAREDIVRHLGAMLQETHDRRLRCIMTVALNESDRFPHLAERFREIAVKPRRDLLRSIIQRGVDTGEFRAGVDVEVAMAALSGAMLFFSKWRDGGEDLPADLAERITGQVLEGLNA